MRAVINVTFICNLECPYCYLQGKKTSDTVGKRICENRKPDEWINGLLWLEEQFEPLITLDISGGEPFVYPYTVELIRKIPTRIWLGLTTNITSIPETLFLVPRRRTDTMSITVSAHLKNGRLTDIFMNNLKNIKKYLRNITVNFVSYPGQDEELEYIKEEMEKIGVPLHIEPYINYNEKKTGFGFSEKALSHFSAEDKRGIELSDRRTLPSPCYVGAKYVWITPDGDIHLCLGRFLEQREPIGNIFKKEIYFKPEVPLMCDIFCPCAQNWRDGNS